jgi:hypothetical protein
MWTAASAKCIGGGRPLRLTIHDLADAGFAAPAYALNLPVAGKPCNVLGSPECERLDRHRRLAPAARHETAAIAYEQVRHVVRAVKPIDDGALGIVAHAARPEQMH